MIACPVRHREHDCAEPLACLRATMAAMDNVRRIDLASKPDAELFVIWPNNKNWRQPCTPSSPS